VALLVRRAYRRGLVSGLEAWPTQAWPTGGRLFAPLLPHSGLQATFFYKKTKTRAADSTEVMSTEWDIPDNAQFGWLREYTVRVCYCVCCCVQRAIAAGNVPEGNRGNLA
jgi:hypothetical protein